MYCVRCLKSESTTLACISNKNLLSSLCTTMFPTNERWTNTVYLGRIQRVYRCTCLSVGVVIWWRVVVLWYAALLYCMCICVVWLVSAAVRGVVTAPCRTWQFFKYAFPCVYRSLPLTLSVYCFVCLLHNCRSNIRMLAQLMSALFPEWLDSKYSKIRV